MVCGWVGGWGGGGRSLDTKYSPGYLFYSVHVVIIRELVHNHFSHYSQTATTPSKSGWDETPGNVKSGSETPGVTPSTRMWDATPGAATPGAATPGKRNRWDETPRWGDTPRAEKTGKDSSVVYCRDQSIPYIPLTTSKVFCGWYCTTWRECLEE